MRILALVTDAFGGHGGIAKFNRDLLTALTDAPNVDKVVAVPRLIPEPTGALPGKLEYVVSGARGKLSFICAAIKSAISCREPTLVFCGHINLLPVAFLVWALTPSAASGARAPLVLAVHGIDAWQPTRSWAVNRLARYVDVVIAVSEFTRKKFWAWARPNRAKGFVLPNCVDLARFTPGAKNPVLLDRYGLRDHTVMLTVARLSAAERYKGIDEVIEVLPSLVKEIPDLRYLIVGDGTDRDRLRQKVEQLGLRERVVFAGHIPETEKVDHYRLADVFVMPGWGEGFGIVYLEALACGVPVVASKLDASQEAALGGRIGVLVNPHEPQEIVSGILSGLRSPRGVPAGVECFSQGNFQMRTQAIIDELATR